jgi:uncharacterized membrane protein YagU involved in acid resistance
MTTPDTAVRRTEFPVHGLGLVVLGGLVAGALDLTFAFVFYGLQGAAPGRILQGIASGILGKASFQMGAASVALGAFCHFFTSVCAAFVYYFASGRFAFLTRHIVISGAVFGVLVFLTMHFVVIPLSAIHAGPLKLWNVVGELCSHIFLFGIVIAFAASRARGSQSVAQPG